jgi:hypothetical protein
MNAKIAKDSGSQISILMGVRNGAAHLADQLSSIANHTHQNWHLICSDDGSTDGSHKILHRFRATHPGQVTLQLGPKSGFSDNYISLLRRLPDRPNYVAFADQDDLWLPEKLAHALHELRDARHIPTLYCGRQSYWYPKQNQSLTSPIRNRPFSLRNALIENVASGNTTMLNPAATALARHAAHHIGPVFAHDWWLYLLITATGGRVIFDNGPAMILYRQHASNVIGAGHGWQAQLGRKMGVMQGLFSDRLDGNLAALAAISDLLTPEARALCNEFENARNARGFARLSALRRIALYRQNRFHTLGFWGASSLGYA